jgi:hypothetical protein
MENHTTSAEQNECDLDALADQFADRVHVPDPPFALQPGSEAVCYSLPDHQPNWYFICAHDGDTIVVITARHRKGFSSLAAATAPPVFDSPPPGLTCENLKLWVLDQSQKLVDARLAARGNEARAACLKREIELKAYKTQANLQIQQEYAARNPIPDVERGILRERRHVCDYLLGLAGTHPDPEVRHAMNEAREDIVAGKHSKKRGGG